MIPDADILEARLRAFHDLPRPIPALLIIQFSDEDLDLLDAARDTPEYWNILNLIVRGAQEES